ncbi:hypothetical protein [Microbulbifer sp. VAAF005]|uniref:hypothetical protein n=1 Tax=Microbulbifer sp. VAAF005 TaxID=3034230 RepID=UPI0024ADE29C|nr:hypothetical protein [Microbulbifer sp. VAAF005]WHI45974.1 hypothetical protein P0078_19980 [Microbulbifer sp. VAAF005]
MIQEAYFIAYVGLKPIGAISQNAPRILERLGISAKHWLYLNRNFESRFKGLVGTAEAVRQACIQLNKRWVHGISDCHRFLSATPH